MAKILSQKTVFKSKFFRVDQITIERNGKTFTKDLIIRSQFVKILPLTAENEIYLIYQYRDALQKVVLEVVGGTIEKEMEPLETAKRELEEEAGLLAHMWKKIATVQLSANLVSIDHFFLAKDLEITKPHPDDDEDLKVIKMPFQEAVTKVITGEISIASNIAAILMLDKLLKQGKI